MDTTEEVLDDSTQAFDYKAEAEALKAEAERLHNQVSNLNKALSEKRKADKVPATDIDQVIESKLKDIERKRMSDDIEEIAGIIATSDEERVKLIETYSSRLNPTGYSRGAIERDLKDAYILVNKDKYISEAEKKARKSVAEKQAMNTASINVSSSQEDDEPDRTPEEKKFLQLMKNYT